MFMVTIFSRKNLTPDVITDGHFLNKSARRWAAVSNMYVRLMIYKQAEDLLINPPAMNKSLGSMSEARRPQF